MMVIIRKGSQSQLQSPNPVPHLCIPVDIINRRPNETYLLKKIGPGFCLVAPILIVLLYFNLVPNSVISSDRALCRASRIGIWGKTSFLIHSFVIRELLSRFYQFPLNVPCFWSAQWSPVRWSLTKSVIEMEGN